VVRRLAPGPSASAAVGILLERLAGTPSAAVIAAAGSVARPGDGLAARLAALAQAPGTPEDRRSAALKALVQIGDPAVLPLLRPRLASDDARVITEAITGLAALRDPELAPRLETWLRERSHPRLWHIAGVGLPALANLDPQRALPVLRMWAVEPHPMSDHRERAVALAAGLGAPGLAIAAAALAEPGLDADWRRRRVAPVLHRAGTAAVPALLPLLDAPAAVDEDRADPGWWAAELIAAAGDPAPVLARGVAAGEPRVRARLARALAMPGQPAALAAFAGFLTDADSQVRRTAAGLAGSLRLPVAAALASARSAESDPRVQAALDDAIARVKAP
jgi:HEAT repeat protein